MPSIIKLKRQKHNLDPFSKKKAKKLFVQKYIDLQEAIVFLNKVKYDISINTINTTLIGLSGLGFLVGLFLKNVYLSLLFSVSFPLMTIEYLLIKKESVAMELDMQIIKYSELIKNTYLSTHSIKDSVSQNMHRFREPIRSIFKDLIYEIEIFNYSPETALKNMVKKLDSPSLEKLANQLILCNKDQRFDASLSALTLQLNDRRQFLQRWKFVSDDALKKFVFMLVLVNGLVLFTFLSYAEMGKAFLESGLSKIMFAVYISIQLIALFNTLKKLNQIKA